MTNIQKPKIGVLALQGAFHLHRPHIEAAHGEYVEVVIPHDFEKIQALILPGGESSTMLKLIDHVGLFKSLENFTKSKPVWGICAGAILLAKTVMHPKQFSFGVIDIEIERNSYGRQKQSCYESVNSYQVSYIRAPKITKASPKTIVHTQREGYPTWVTQTNVMVTTFHPETNLSLPSPWHRQLIQAARFEKSFS